jgi:hypothetical protein
VKKGLAIISVKGIVKIAKIILLEYDKKFPLNDAIVKIAKIILLEYDKKFPLNDATSNLKMTDQI